MKKVFVSVMWVVLVFAIISGCSEDPQKYTKSGMEKLQNNDFEGAIADFNKAIELDPKNAVAYLNRANARFGIGDLDCAVADFDKAIELKPDDANGYIGRATIFLALHEIEKAEQNVSKALEIDPNNPAAQTIKGQIDQVKATSVPE